ncbi:MAG: circadian clock KaiB family protein [Wenzhouxiangella sp.]|jgi:circadian clock protein KaiB|nr:circadian clock KaiB family protein [Wenzhouxiangella sp.]
MNASNEPGESSVPALMLFVTGDAPRSLRAQSNLEAALTKLGCDAIKPLQVDLLEQPEQSVSYSVFATPALLRTKRDGKISTIYGDLSDESKLLDFLKPLAAK